MTINKFHIISEYHEDTRFMYSYNSVIKFYLIKLYFKDLLFMAKCT